MNILRNSSRYNYIDYAKGFAIICVILGHTLESTHKFVFLFHMPLFFIISGLWAYKNNKMEPLQFIKKSIRNILLPWSVLYLLMITARIIVGVIINENNFEVVVYDMLRSVLYGGYGLWFLPVLFVALTESFCLSKINNVVLRIIYGLIIASISLLILDYYKKSGLKIILVTYVLNGLICNLYLMVGEAFRYFVMDKKEVYLHWNNCNTENKISTKTLKKYLAIIGFLSLVVALFYNITIDPGLSDYHLGLFGIFLSSIISVFWILVFEIIDAFKCSNTLKTLAFLGQHSLIAYGWHMCEQPIFPVKMVLTILFSVHFNDQFAWFIIFIIKVVLAYTAVFCIVFAKKVLSRNKQ